MGPSGHEGGDWREVPCPGLFYRIDVLFVVMLAGKDLHLDWLNFFLRSQLVKHSVAGRIRADFQEIHSSDLIGFVRLKNADFESFDVTRRHGRSGFGSSSPVFLETRWDKISDQAR